MTWTKTCGLAHARTTFPIFDSRTSNEAATSASSKNKFDPTGPKTYESRGIYEEKQKALDQTDAQDRADLFRVHVLRGRDLSERY
jgi:hypothetical protein